MNDLGYFGPDTLTWRIHSEPVSMVGGLRALLLQALHPGAMAKLYQTSSFQDDPWARLQRTVNYVGVVSFSPTVEVDRAAAHVRGVHRRLGVDDPEQLAWVHACLVESFLVAARASGLRLSRSDVDRYVAEQAVAAELVGVPVDRIVHTRAELTAFMTEIRPRLAGTPEAREAAKYVIAPPLPVPRRLVLPARLGWTTVSSLAVGLLPGWARRMYRLPPLPGARLATTTGMRVLRGAVQTLPARYREGPLYQQAKARAAARD
ncbi:MAG: oxygenase MpaB family protein [Jatrophihabitantaceae bacterium]